MLAFAAGLGLVAVALAAGAPASAVVWWLLLAVPFPTIVSSDIGSVGALIYLGARRSPDVRTRPGMAVALLSAAALATLVVVPGALASAGDPGPTAAAIGLLVSYALFHGAWAIARRMDA